MPQINLSIWYALSFFLVILSIGYITIEIILGEKYRFREIINKSKNPLFDRVIHYIIRGFLINGMIFLIYPICPLTEKALKQIIISGIRIGKIINSENYLEISTAIISFLYFFVLVLTEYTIMSVYKILNSFIKEMIKLKERQ